MAIGSYAPIQYCIYRITKAFTNTFTKLVGARSRRATRHLRSRTTNMTQQQHKHNTWLSHAFLHVHFSEGGPSPAVFRHDVQIRLAASWRAELLAWLYTLHTMLTSAWWPRCSSLDLNHAFETVALILSGSCHLLYDRAPAPAGRALSQRARESTSHPPSRCNAHPMRVTSMPMCSCTDAVTLLDRC